MKDYYQILQISPEADATEIKRSFRRLATQYHPDKNADPAANQIFQEINEAYHVLADSQQRQLYDLQRLYPSATATYTPYTPKPQQPRRPPPAYRAQRRVYLDLRPYVVFARIVSKVSLAFCLVLALDYLLPWPSVEEPLVGLKFFNRTGRIEVTTPNRIFTMPLTQELQVDLSRYNPVLIYHTPLLASVVQAELRGMKVRTDNNIYGNLIFFPVLLLILSLLGLFSNSTQEMMVNFGIAATIILLITLSLVFLIFRL
jgi:hypothetical protein